MTRKVDVLELRDILRTLRKGWILLLALAMAGLIGGAMVSIVSPAVYSATAKVLVSVKSSGAATPGDLTQANALAQEKAMSFVNFATSAQVLKSAIDRLHVNMTPTALAAHVTATSTVNSAVIVISATNSNAGEAADIANAVSEAMSEFIVNTVERPQGGGASPIGLTSVQTAVAASSPTTPRENLNLAVGLLVGLALGLSVVLARAVLDSRIYNLSDVEKVTELPVLAGIANARSATGPGVVVRKDPNSAEADAFRRLRTNLQAFDFGGHPRSVVITSALVGEGKTTVAVNLAVALSDAGAKVLLIDGDLRYPSLAPFLGLERGVGLSDVLTGRAPLGEAMLPWGSGELYVLPAGHFHTAPSDLLGSQPMTQLLELLGAQFDYVLIDAPPLLPVTDAAALGRIAAAVVLVAAAGHVKRGELDFALRALAASGSRAIGIVLTMLPLRGFDGLGFGADDAYYAPKDGATSGVDGAPVDHV